MATNAFWSANALLRPVRSKGDGYTSPNFSCEGTHVHDQCFCPETYPHPRNDRRRDAYLQFQSRQLAGTRQSLHVRVDIQYRRCHPALMVRHPQKDQAYTLLNIFWVLVGLVGILRAGNFIH